MPLLRPGDPLPRRPCRILVAGASGAGKTTLAARLGEALGIRHVEIDALFHGPGWVPRPSFVGDVEAFTAEDAWVTEWQYGLVRGLLGERADVLAWLDLPRRTVLRQVTARTVVRRLRREVLWNGNVEPPLRTILTDRDHVIRWSWRTHRSVGERVARLLEQRPDLPVYRLRSHREADLWLRRVVDDAQRD
ncbi:AAA family ATPase [Georgenia sp. MJ206]|uniref:AAA family ATPase n=1 Tax=Georgenia wangjunii TaxID=3117730 RepID=UPI002F26AA03